MPPERFQPKNDKRGAEDCRAEHYLQGDKRLIPARREPGQLLLNEIKFPHHLGIGLSRLIGLAEGKAGGVEVGHVACLGLVRDHK